VFIEPRARERAGHVYGALEAAHVHAAFRAGALRFSPHLYNTPDDIERALTVLDRT
jgi:selenocysteine lyase/cysteine desulfurase